LFHNGYSNKILYKLPEKRSVVQEKLFCYNSDVTVSFFCLPESAVVADETEVARYLGYKKTTPPDEPVIRIIHDSCEKMHAVLKPQAVYETFSLVPGADNMLSFAGNTINSVDLSRNLHDCGSVVLLAATIGPQVDMMIKRAQIRSSTEAAIMQAAGAMFIESFVDAVNKRIKTDAVASGRLVHPRYSPGYGDVTLSVQRMFFLLLPCSRIGLSLMPTLIMAPEKSVTAFVGIE